VLGRQVISITKQSSLLAITHRHYVADRSCRCEFTWRARRLP